MVKIRHYQWIWYREVPEDKTSQIYIESEQTKSVINDCIIFIINLELI